jgi:hypothetical protein
MKPIMFVWCLHCGFVASYSVPEEGVRPIRPIPVRCPDCGGVESLFHGLSSSKLITNAIGEVSEWSCE